MIGGHNFWTPTPQKYQPLEDWNHNCCTSVIIYCLTIYYSVMAFCSVAYGFGTLMVILLSLLSLIGAFVVPLVKQNERCGVVYEYVNLFLVAMGTSALFSDAILHLIPQVCTQGKL